jgi:hypothetical protein
LGRLGTKVFRKILDVGSLFILLNISGFAADSTEVVEDELPAVSYGFENDFITQYIWRGISYNEGFILQPSVWIEYDGFTFYTWGSLTLNDKHNNPKNHEVDFAVQYTYQYEELFIEPSIAYYIYPGQEEAPPTAEANLKLAYTLLEIEVYTNVCLDVLEYPGSLSGDIGLKKSLFENDDVNIFADISTGWANKKFNKTYVGESDENDLFNFVRFAFEMEYYVSENIYLKPHAEYYYIFSPVLKSVSGNNLTNLGLLFGVEF